MSKKTIFGNAILLAISTLPKHKENKELFSVSESQFIWGDKIISDCRGQLEPIVKIMIDDIDLNRKNKELKIIMLCSKETKEICKQIEYKGNISEAINSVEYFKNRINSYILENNKKVKIEYKSLDFNEENLVDDIHKITNLVRNLYEECSDLNLWIDTHGGFRDMALVCNAIISLLRLENPRYVPNKILGVHFGDKKEIVDQKEMFDIFKFACGMQDFANNGNADILEEISSKESVEVIEVMQTIADGLKECNPNKYVEGIEKFSKLGDISEIIKDKKDMLKIFAPYINSQYENLMDDNGPCVEKIIKRCIDKKMYQQALTLIESKMPAYMMKKGLMYYEYADETKIDIAKRYNRFAYKENENYIFDEYVRVKAYFFKKEFKDSDTFINDNRSELTKYIDAQIKEFASRSEGIESVFIDGLDKRFINNTFELSCKTDVNKSETIVLKTKLTKRSDREKAGSFMRMHNALKKCRNSFNHGEDERVEMTLLISLLKMYIKTAEELINIL